MRQFLWLIVASCIALSSGYSWAAKPKEVQSASLSPAVKHQISAGEPYGANLFQGQFSADAGTGVSTSYRVQPGDEVAVSMWGAGESDATLNLRVDAQGMIFIPNVGPVHVGGELQSSLNELVAGHVGEYYQQDVKVYTNLRGAQSVSVFVTGGVERPGRYSGNASDSMLHYLDRAGGIDANRGSYRTVDIMRGDKTIATLDLYDFLMRGSIPALQLKDNDVVFVHSLQSTVVASGAVQNPNRFEFTSPTLSGTALLDLARPLPDITHAIVSGIREGQGFANYLSISELQRTTLQQGDTVDFKSGTLNATITTTIEGENLGPQVIIAPSDAHLKEVLRHVHVDPALADIHSVFLRRRSVALRQKEALQDSLRRLEAAVVGTAPTSEQDANIKTQEAKLVQMFVERAAQVIPEGRVVVAEDGQLRDVALEDGDVIVIPRQTNLVMVNGEVTMPKAVVYKEGEGPSYYIERAGGYTERADESNWVLARLNGETVAKSNAIKPGDEVIVMPQVQFSDLQMAKDVMDILYKVAISVAVPLRFL